jgi:signal transduction histidine kinase
VRPRRLGLRSRLVLTFGVGGLLLATFLAALTYSLARGYLLRQRENAAVRAARANAGALGARLATPETDLRGLLDALGRRSGTDAEALLLVDGEFFGTTAGTAPAHLPAEFVAAAGAGDAVRQRFRGATSPRLAVGVPIVPGTAYVEVVSLAELERTLRTLSGALLAAAAVTCVGFAGLGWGASRRVLRPVTDVARAASAIAEGRLDTRLDVGDDPNLRPLADSFNAMADALQRRIERDTRFTADVSHELRSPLTALAASFSVLESHETELTPRPRQAVRLLAREISRFTGLVEDLLEISRADAGPPLELEEVRIDDLVRRTLHRPAYAGVPVDVEGDPIVVRADKRRLDRVLVNLLDNAAHHGGGAVRVGVRRVGDLARIEVDDAGPGVASEERERIFERFARGSVGADRRRGRGAGLGLALVGEHVRAHGGRVAVTDRPGGGARFVVDLPVAG